MDTLRGNFGDHGSGSAEYRDAERDDDVRHEPPAMIGQDERRMQVSAYNHWASLLDNRNFPSIEDLDAENLPDFGPFSVLLDFTGGIENPAILYLGDKLAEECGADSSIQALDDVPSRSLLSRITDHYMQILANQAPIGFEAEFVNQREATILYRGILLPYSSDDETIDFIYGVINWKELADQATTDELLLEIDQALAVTPEPRRGMVPAAPMDEWADDDDADNVLDLTADAAIADDGNDWPSPTFALQADGADDTGDMELADWLASARELAQAAQGSEDRGRSALYVAIGRAYDFALAANEQPDDDLGVAQIKGDVLPKGIQLMGVVGKQHQRCQPGRANGVALGDCLGGVAHSVQRIGDVAHTGGQLGHFGNATGVVGDGAVGI